MLRIRPDHLSRLLAIAVALLTLPFLGCGNGDGGSDLIVVPLIKANVVQIGCVAPAQPAVVLENVTAVGDVVNMDVVLSGTTDTDDVDLVMRYDASFMQVSTIRPETIFGTCGTVNPACNLLSPVCLSNLSAANGGGTKYCRSNGSTFCQADTDCTASGDACGNFGQLEVSLAVLTGPRICSNKPGQSCLAGSDCRFCNGNKAIACGSNAADLSQECRGSCVGSVCSGGSFNGAPCSSNFECLDTCGVGTCSGCPSVPVSGSKRITNISLRVIATGVSILQFVTSTNPAATASHIRKDTLDLPVEFCPSVDAADPTAVVGSFTVTATK